jgi:hypothetical protein
VSASAIPARRVKRLHLVAPDATLHGRGVRLIEDALRTATLPDAGARLLFIRRFALARFSARISPQSLALALERRVAALARAAVHAADPLADAAPAVWFRDALEAHVLLALRIVEGAPAAEWFWPFAVPAACAPITPDDRLRAVVLALAQRVEAPAALPRLAARLAARGHARALVECLDEDDGAVLLAAAKVGTDDAAPRPLLAMATHARAARAPLDAPGAHALAHTLAVPDAPARWIAAMLRRAGMPAVEIAAHLRDAPNSPVHREPVARSRATHDLPSQPRRSPSSGVGFRRSSHTRPMPHAADARATRTRPADPAAARIAPVGAIAQRAALAPLAPEPAVHAAPPAADAADAVTPGRIDQDAWPAGAPSAAGGIVFLLAVMETLGYAGWSAALPDAHARAIAAEVLAQALSRLRVDPFDAAHALVDELRPARSETAGVEACAMAAPWLAACRGWLRRHARITLRTLVLRPARLHWTATHLDVRFDLRALDVRVRRAGLDLDPGWVPWIARVVSFHYEQGVHSA